jgi:hypothetical protein
MRRSLRLPNGAYLLSVLLCLGGCGWLDSEINPEPPRLRITNVGSTPILGLSVVFPYDRISFGDIPVGATTQYKAVPSGVYRAAAYSLRIDGAIVTQPVLDWVGEEPMEGHAFTYALDVDPRRPQLQVVQLVNVTRDD